MAEHVLVTGAAGFVGAALAHALLDRGARVTGVDSLNDYYDVALKRARLERLEGREGFAFRQGDLAEREASEELFSSGGPGGFDRVAHMAAQPGVRHSLTHPRAYLRANVDAFLNVLEGCRHAGVGHLVYASSSSVYGANATPVYRTHEPVAHPVSLYAATKLADEAMAHSYSHLYGLPTTGLRFFTVFGPWGRPDMAPMIFLDRLFRGEPLTVHNRGEHARDFTFIDDIVDGIIRVLDRPPEPDPDFDHADPRPDRSSAPWRIYNIGQGRPTELMDFIRLLKEASGREAALVMADAQPGDVARTHADVSALERDTGFAPKVTTREGVKRLVAWYREFYGV